jgi:hypothetical protein
MKWVSSSAKRQYDRTLAGAAPREHAGAAGLLVVHGPRVAHSTDRPHSQPHGHASRTTSFSISWRRERRVGGSRRPSTCR